MPAWSPPPAGKPPRPAPSAAEALRQPACARAGNAGPPYSTCPREHAKSTHHKCITYAQTGTSQPPQHSVLPFYKVYGGQNKDGCRRGAQRGLTLGRGEQERRAATIVSSAPVCSQLNSSAEYTAAPIAKNACESSSLLACNAQLGLNRDWFCFQGRSALACFHKIHDFLEIIVARLKSGWRCLLHMQVSVAYTCY